MDQQTKVGIGAAAGLALMALLEPHFFETHPTLTALIYAFFVCVMLWGFGPAVFAASLKLRGRFKRMWPQYLMAASGVMFFVGLVAFLQMNVTPPDQAPKPGPLASLSNPLLRERAIAMAQGLRHLEQEYQSKRKQLSYENFELRRSLASETDRSTNWHNENRRSMALTDEMEGEFRDKYRSDVIILRDEFRVRLKLLPMPEGRYPNGLPFRPDLQIFDKPFLTGPDPLSGGADLLEYWAKQLS